MVDDSIMPGWRCVAEEGDAELVCVMLANHGVEAEMHWSILWRTRC
jgi:hypothetical protein